MLQARDFVQARLYQITLGMWRPEDGSRLWREDDPDAHIIDEYDIPIQIDAPPGKYLIEAGLYELTTGQRLPVLDAAGAPQDNRIILGEVQVAGD